MFLFAGGAQFLLGVLLAETLYPGYSVANNYISDLGVGPEPSATIFNVSVFLFGLLGACGAFFLWRGARDRIFVPTLLLSGLGAMGVGVFNENMRPFHLIMAFTAFFFGALVAVVSYRLVRRPLSYMSALLGLISLAALSLYATENYLGIGAGGMERMVLYPTLMWIIGMGALLMARGAEKGFPESGPSSPVR